LWAGEDPIFQTAPDFDLALTESRTLDGHTQELVYRPPCCLTQAFGLRRRR
jgi:hypothetical protein